MDHFMGKINSKNHESTHFLYSFKDHRARHKCSLVRILSHPTWPTNNTTTHTQLWQSYTKGPVQTFLLQTKQNRVSEFWQPYTNCGISSSRSSNCCIRFSRGLWQVGVPSDSPGSSEFSLGWPLGCAEQVDRTLASGSDFTTGLWGTCRVAGGTAAEGTAVFSSVPLTLRVGLGGL